MIKRISTLSFLFFLLAYSSVFGDVLFTHELQSNDYMLGRIDSQIVIGYTDQIKYTNKTTEFNGNFLKRFFGKVKTSRSTSEFNLKENIFSEVDWENAYIYTYPLDKISDPEWHKKRTPFVKEREEFTKERYMVSPPEISFDFMDTPEMIDGYSTRKVVILLTLLTHDKKKNAQSHTKIVQTLWLTDRVEGFDLYNKFNQALSLKIGVDQHRLGLLGDLLQNFPQKLDSIEKDLSKIKGYAVKSHFHMEGSYIQNFKDKPPKKSSMVLKDETMVLKTVLKTASLDAGLFAAPAEFSKKIIK